MNMLLRVLIFLLILTVVFCSGGCYEIPRPPSSDSVVNFLDDDGDEVSGDGRSVTNYEYMKAVWVSQFDMCEVYLCSGVQREERDFRRLVGQMMGNIRSLGFNTVIFQVRPYGDSIYPSEVYSPSAVAVGEYGGDFLYDPFRIVVEEAHRCGLSLQAWINPLRLMNDGEIGLVGDEYAVGRWYREGSARIQKVGGRWYLDPAYAEVRSLIVDGVCEIIENYEVDGIHMDDYFYPTSEPYFDFSSYVEYLSCGGRIPVGEWRRGNINRLVSEIYSSVKRYSGELIFGISPAGNFKTAYEEQYADIYTWCAEEGYIDYICPQVYFGFEHGSYDFIKVTEKYRSIIKNDEVRLIVGMTLAKAYDGYLGIPDRWAGSGAYEWIERRDILGRQLEYASKIEECSGVAYFSYRFFFDPLSGDAVAETAEEREGLLKLLWETE